MNKQVQLSNFLSERPALNVMKIEQEAEMPARTLYKFQKGHIPALPEKHWPNLEKVLKKYGWDCK